MSKVSTFQITYKNKLVLRFIMSIGALGMTLLGVVCCYRSMTLRVNDFIQLGSGIFLCLTGIFILCSYNYYRLILTDNALIQEGLFINRVVTFDTVTVIEPADKGSYHLYNDNSKIKIYSDVEQIDELIYKIIEIIEEQ